MWLAFLIYIAVVLLLFVTFQGVVRWIVSKLPFFRGRIDRHDR